MSVKRSVRYRFDPYTIGCEDNVAVLEKLVAHQIGKGVVFLVEGEDVRVGGAWVRWLGQHECGDFKILTGVDLLFDLLLVVSKEESLGTT